ncbi:hypothetical protein [Nonomuraea sp. NPDC048916]|uniref:hypothetical protein n=1 Tax=Nonomuraea sp. NPDC048916 TaxID=3154232 RepID=UPI0033FE5FCF
MVGRVVAAAVVVAGAIGFGGAAQAAVVTKQAGAAGQITSPADGQVVSSGSVQVSARTGVMQLKMALYVEGPSTSRQQVAQGGANQTISGTFDAGSAPNGTFTVILKGEISQSTYATSTFKLRRPAAPPSNVDAALQGTEKIQVTWNKGTEPDLQSYEVSTSQSGVVGRLPVDSACSGSSCRAVLAVPPKAVGQRVGFTVKAFRSDGDGGSVESGRSGAAYVKVPAPKAAQPAKTAKPSNNDATKGTEALPTLPGKKQAKIVTTPTRKQTTPKNNDKLPAMPDTDRQGNLPIPTADTDPGRSDSLTPQDTKADTDSEPVDTNVTAQASESPFGTMGQYGLFVAGGIVLLLLAAHVGAWARRRALVAEGGAGSTVAATPPSGGGPAQMSADSIPPTATTPRRPAIVLAVAKTRQATEEPRLTESEQAGAAQDFPATQGSENAAGAVQGSERHRPPEKRRTEVPVALPLHRSADDMRATAQEAARQEPIRLAPPSSAVTVVPESLASATPPAVHIEDRWDDYLPPSPRSMEDSGFWERPQPGAGDFWAADEEENAYAGRRHRDGDS